MLMDLYYSKSVQNRRKPRAGFALEHHVKALFKIHGLSFSRGAITENRSKPDYLFPGATQYHDESFAEARLTMLGLKTSLKKRWRQIEAEAKRINPKHLLTLEPGISIHQTNEMQSHGVQLVIPQSLHSSYTPEQQGWLMSLKEFIDLVKSRESDGDTSLT